MSAVTREWLVDDQLARLPWGSRAFTAEAPPVRVGVTGTGDRLLVLGWAASELARERAAGARLLASLGIAPGMRVANTLAGALVTPGALLLGDVVEELGALDVPLGVPDSDAAARGGWALLDRVACDVLVLDPATAPAFLAARPDTRRPWWKGVVWLRTETTPAPPPLGFGGRQRTWLALPEAASFVAGSCAAERFHPVAALAVSVEDERLVVGVPADTRPAFAYRSTLAARKDGTCTCGAAGAAFEAA